MNDINFNNWLLNVIAGGDLDPECTDKFILNAYAIRFNREITEIIGEYGEESVNAAIWYLYGGGSGMTSEILDPSQGSQRFEFMDSVRGLYANGFVRFCSRHFGHLDRGPEPPRPLNSACYMLWDMDGIECPAINGDKELLDASIDVLSFALRLESWACQESALHGLGHLAMKFPNRTTSVIESYLRRDDHPPELKMYAQSALAGCVL